jgi:hypothetical protein
MTLYQDRVKGSISEHIRGLVWIYNVCVVKDERAWDLFDHIIFLHPVTTRQFSQFRLMWLQHRRRSSSFLEWWDAFLLYKWQMFYKTHDQMNNWRWDTHHVFGDQVNRSNPQTTSPGMVSRTCECFSLYGCDDLSATIKLPSCRQYKPGDFVAVRRLN